MTEHEKLIMAYGYTPIESKNPHMRSYVNDENRINYYFTTGTVTIQPFERRGKIVTLHSPLLEQLEDYL